MHLGMTEIFSCEQQPFGSGYGSVADSYGVSSSIKEANLVIN
jgi:uncharacterized glyoxalase superfamily protein PhnB